MKCILCPNEIDDKKEFPVAYSEERRGFVYDEAGQRAHAAEQNRWKQIEVALGPCGELSLLIGHACPDCSSPEGLTHIELRRAEAPVRALESRQIARLGML